MARIIVLSTGEKYRMRTQLTSIARLSKFSSDAGWREYSSHMTREATDYQPNEHEQSEQQA